MMLMMIMMMLTLVKVVDWIRSAHYYYYCYDNSSCGSFWQTPLYSDGRRRLWISTGSRKHMIMEVPGVIKVVVNRVR